MGVLNSYLYFTIIYSLHKIIPQSSHYTVTVRFWFSPFRAYKKTPGRKTTCLRPFLCAFPSFHIFFSMLQVEACPVSIRLCFLYFATKTSFFLFGNAVCVTLLSYANFRKVIGNR